MKWNIKLQFSHNNFDCIRGTFLTRIFYLHIQLLKMMIAKKAWEEAGSSASIDWVPTVF